MSNNMSNTLLIECWGWEILLNETLEGTREWERESEADRYIANKIICEMNNIIIIFFCECTFDKLVKRKMDGCLCQ
jgi:hypothetical protein